jgi:uncharacterized protein (DUF1697 family)
MPERGRQVALLRGINVGRAKRVAMADLRTLVTKLGYTNVTTLLNSGNVVFTAPGVTAVQTAALIGAALGSRLGVSSRVVSLTGANIDTIVAENTLLDVADNPSRLFVAVLMNLRDRSRLTPLAKEKWAPQALALGSRAAYLWCPDGVLNSRLTAAVAKTLGDRVTTRNWATMLKLQALMKGSGS